MDFPEVSIIIPTYNQAEYLAEAIQSALDQTYSKIEVIVVNDASTDNTDEVMSRFNDPRLKYITHEQNRYAAAARNTGIRAASGELISFLDADDRFHPDKLQVQVVFLKENHQIGLTYNSRFEMDQDGLLLALVKVPPAVTITDLVLGYPYAPSEVVMRKDWAFRVGLFDESFLFSGEDPDFHMRLALQGCEMVGVNRVLNFRRLHAGRVFRNLPGVVDEQIRAFGNTFADPRCPPDVLALREKSLGKTHMIFSYYAFVQNETELGHSLLRQAVWFDRSILDYGANRLLEFLVSSSIRDGGEHEGSLRKVFDQLPPELKWLIEYADKTIASGYLRRGTRDILWGRVEDGRDHLNKAESLGAYIDMQFLHYLISHLRNFESEFGQCYIENVLTNMGNILTFAGYNNAAHKLMGDYSINRAFKDYRTGKFNRVPSSVIKAIRANPTYVTNRGVISIFIHSLFAYNR